MRHVIPFSGVIGDACCSILAHSTLAEESKEGHVYFILTAALEHCCTTYPAIFTASPLLQKCPKGRNSNKTSPHELPKCPRGTSSHVTYSHQLHQHNGKKILGERTWSFVQLTFQASSDDLIVLLQNSNADCIPALCFIACLLRCTRNSFNVIGSMLFVSTLRGRTLHVQNVEVQSSPASC